MYARLRVAMATCSSATITMQLLKRGLRATAMRGVVPLSREQGRAVGEARTLGFIPMRDDISDPATTGARENPQRRSIEECPADGDTRLPTLLVEVYRFTAGRIQRCADARVVSSGWNLNVRQFLSRKVVFPLQTCW